MNGFVSQYVREQKRYTKNEIKSLFDFSESEVEAFIRRLKAYGVVKAVRNTPQQLDLSELSDGDLQISDETAESGDCLYVFAYVGVLTLGNGVDPRYTSTDRLIDIIGKPKWIGYRADGTSFTREAEDTLIPDLISIYADETGYSFVIFDAKYYCIQLDLGRPVRNQPGVGDVTKQYLYQLAYHEFIQDHSLGTVKNCFLMPTQENDIIPLGAASMDILDGLGLQQIQIRLLPATRMYDLYLTRKTMPVSELHL